MITQSAEDLRVFHHRALGNGRTGRPGRHLLLGGLLLAVAWAGWPGRLPAQQPKPPAVPAAQPQPGDLPPPRTLPPFREGQIRLPRMAGPIGATPHPTEPELAEYRAFIDKMVDPRNTFDLILGRVRLIVLKDTPVRVQVGDERVASYNLVDPMNITIVGKQVGSTVLNLWFRDPADPTKEKVLSYLVRVLPDPEEKVRLERVYQALGEELNRAFPDSHVHLFLVGDKLVVSGQVKDIAEATQILRIVVANAPGGSEGGAQSARLPLTNIRPVARTGQPGDDPATPGIADYILSGAPNVINLLRVAGEQQVMLKVTVAEVNRAAARSIGINFTIANNQGITVFANNTGNIFTNGRGGIGNQGGILAPAFGSLTNNLPIRLDGGQINVALNALRNLNYARSLAEPNLVALNGQTASFQAGGQFPVPVVTGFVGGGGGGLQGVSFIPFGVQLAFTPYVTDKDRVRLSVEAEVSTRQVGLGTTIQGANVAGLNTRNFQTTVELREGQTLAVAGLIQNDLGADATHVPLLGDLPIIGRAFAFDRYSSSEQELVVLVTPELVHPLEPKEVPALPGSDLFEPGDIEFYLLGRLESRRSEDYRAGVRTDIHRMKAYEKCEKVYIQGPSGHSPQDYQP